MRFDEFVSDAEAYWRANPSQRKGQAYFNLLYRFRSDLANSLRSGPYDPFYNDDRLTDFLVTVQERW